MGYPPWKGHGTSESIIPPTPGCELTNKLKLLPSLSFGCGGNKKRHDLLQLKTNEFVFVVTQIGSDKVNHITLQAAECK